MTEVDIVIEAEGQLGYRKVSDVEGLKHGDLIEVRTVTGGDRLSENVVLARYLNYRCDDGERDEMCSATCCTYVAFFGSDITRSPEKLAFVRKVKIVAADESNA